MPVIGTEPNQVGTALVASILSGPTYSSANDRPCEGGFCKESNPPAPQLLELSCSGAVPEWKLKIIGDAVLFAGNVPAKIVTIENLGFGSSVFHIASPVGLPTRRLLLQPRFDVSDPPYSAILISEKTIAIGSCVVGASK